LHLLSCVCGACWAGQSDQAKKQGEKSVGEQAGRFARGLVRLQGSAIRGKGAGQSSQRKNGGEQGDAAIHVLSSEPRLNVA
jgi:hypothetical protein